MIIDGKCSLPSIASLKSDYLFGLRMTDDQGNPFPDSLYQRALDSATRWIETELQLTLATTNVVESHDYRMSEYMDFAYLQLYQYPVQKVNSIVAKYAGQVITEFPVEWIRLFKESAQINLVPTNGTLSNILITKSGAFAPLLFGQVLYVPGLFEINYVAGFEDDKIPCDIINVVYKKASIDVLNILGDLILEPGVANFSVSVDGLSQSIGTTASAENNAMSARVRMYLDDLKKDLKTLKAYWIGQRIVAA